MLQNYNFELIVQAFTKITNILKFCFYTNA